MNALQEDKGAVPSMSSSLKSLPIPSVQELFFTLKNYSARIASVGFNDAARRAGMKLATSADAVSRHPTDSNVVISQGLTPNSILRSRPAVANEQRTPPAIPNVANQQASAKMSP